MRIGLFEDESGEWELSPEDLAELFEAMGWEYATPTLGYGIPGPEQIRAIFRELAKELIEDGRPSVMAPRGRFLAVKHDPDSEATDLYINVGYMWDDAFLTNEDEENGR